MTAASGRRPIRLLLAARAHYLPVRLEKLSAVHERLICVCRQHYSSYVVLASRDTQVPQNIPKWKVLGYFDSLRSKLFGSNIGSHDICAAHQ